MLQVVAEFFHIFCKISYTCVVHIHVRSTVFKTPLKVIHIQDEKKGTKARTLRNATLNMFLARSMTINVTVLLTISQIQMEPVIKMIEDDSFEIDLFQEILFGDTSYS